MEQNTEELGKNFEEAGQIAHKITEQHDKDLLREIERRVM